jgi:hypothetical protein
MFSRPDVVRVLPEFTLKNSQCFFESVHFFFVGAVLGAKKNTAKPSPSVVVKSLANVLKD